MNYRFLSTPEKIERLKHLHHQTCTFMKQQAHLKVKLKEAILQQEVMLDDDMTTDLCSVTKEEQQHMEKEFLEESFQQILWDQQQQATSVQDMHEMRWYG